MPKDETAGIQDALDLDAESANDANDDVVDLLEVVKPGKALAAAGGDDVDFSADLESMLDSLSQVEKAHDDAQGAVFPDPAPVDHEVDHNESLDLPGMDDLDAILNSLGAEAAPSPPPAAGDNLSADALDLEDLDAPPAVGAPAKTPGPADADYLDILFAEAENADAAGPADAAEGGTAEPHPDGATEHDALQGATAPAGAGEAVDADGLLAELGLDDEFPTASPDPSAGMEFSLDAPVPDPDAPPTARQLDPAVPNTAETPAGTVTAHAPDIADLADIAAIDDIVESAGVTDAAAREDAAMFEEAPPAAMMTESAASATTAALSDEELELLQAMGAGADVAPDALPDGTPDVGQEAAQQTVHQAGPVIEPGTGPERADAGGHAPGDREEGPVDAPPSDLDVLLDAGLAAEDAPAPVAEADAADDFPPDAADAAPSVPPAEDPDLSATPIADPAASQEDIAKLELSLDTAAGDIASEALDIRDDGIEGPDPSQASAPTSQGALAPEPAMEEDAPLNDSVTTDVAHAPDPAEIADAPLVAEPAAAPDALWDTPPEEAQGDAPADPATDLGGAEPSASRFDEVDFNELDSLLDDMLASAPASGPGPALAAQPKDAGPGTTDPVEDGDGLLKGFGAGLAALRLDVERLREQLASMAAGGKQHGAVAVLEDAAASLKSHAASLSAQAARLEELEERLTGKGAPAEEQESIPPALEDRLRYLEGQILSLETKLDEEAGGGDTRAEPDRLGERMDGLKSRLERIETQFADFSTNLEKMAAEAAAKVIREEITAMMAEGDL